MKLAALGIDLIPTRNCQDRSQIPRYDNGIGSAADFEGLFSVALDQDIVHREISGRPSEMAGRHAVHRLHDVGDRRLVLLPGRGLRCNALLAHRWSVVRGLMFVRARINAVVNETIIQCKLAPF